MPAPRRPVQRRSRDKVERILDATRALLVAEGPEALNTNRVAREAGIGVGSLYEYFPNKQAIVGALIERLAQEEADRVMADLELLDELPPTEAVRRLLTTTVELYRENHALFGALWSISAVARSVGHRPGEQAIIAGLERFLAPRAAELGIEDVPLASFTCFHLVEALVGRFVEEPATRWDDERCAAEITKVVLRYLGLWA